MPKIQRMRLRGRCCFAKHIEVRDSRTGYLVPVRDGPGASPDLESCWDAAVAVVAVIWKFRSTFWLGNYICSLSYGLRVLVGRIWTWRPGFYSEFRYKSYEHSGLACGAILGKLFGLTLFPSLPCSCFRNMFQKNSLVPKRPRQLLNMDCQVHIL